MIMELKVLKPFTHFNDGIVHALTDDGSVVDFDDEDKLYDKSDFDSYIDKLNTEYTKKITLPSSSTRKARNELCQPE